MKANKAPEKLYFNTSDINGILDIYSNKESNNEVEYIRTDAFIEKAVNFLEMLGYGFTITDNITHANYDKEQLIEDFRNYIEGE
ncbi:MAG: hypothetical protein K6F74_05325 [Prevotella sp.]|nr:hypothetical protein [Prevotella sp.]